MRFHPALAIASILLIAGCVATPPSPAAGTYRALGQEPGWSLEISRGRMRYVGDYGDKRIDLPAPEPRATFNGHRYEARRQGHSLVVDVTHALCYDAMSGHAYSDSVMVTADANIVRGCGGNHVPSEDM